jgi:hypothetical protein
LGCATRAYAYMYLKTQGLCEEWGKREGAGGRILEVRRGYQRE